MQAAQFMKRADSSEGSTVACGSPIGTKLSWADLCDDSDDDSWEEKEAAPKAQAPQQAPGTPPPAADTAARTEWQPTGRGPKPSGKPAPQSPQQKPQPHQQELERQAQYQQSWQQQQLQQRGSPKGTRAAGRGPQQQMQRQGQAPGGRRAPPSPPLGACALPPPMLGCGMPPPGCNPMDTYAVVLEGVPINLCNDVCLDAMLHQAGLQGAVAGCEIKAGGAAKITLSHWQAAVMCFHHFSTSRWATCSLKVRMLLPNKKQLGPDSWKEQPEKSETPSAVIEAAPGRRGGGAWPNSPQSQHYSAPSGMPKSPYSTGGEGKSDEAVPVVSGFMCVPVQFVADGQGGTWQPLVPLPCA